MIDTYLWMWFLFTQQHHHPFFGTCLPVAGFPCHCQHSVWGWGVCIVCPGTYPPLTLVVAQATVPTVVLSPASCCILGHDNLSIDRSFHLMQQNSECATVSCPLDCITQDFAISKNRWCPFRLCKANWMVWSLWKVPISLFSGFPPLPHRHDI